jgi:predicted MPP superfamily phosphohydrolase
MVGLLGLSGAVACDAWLIEPRWIRVERSTIRIRGLGSAWHDARVVLLSDTHCGPYTSPEYIAHAVEMANGLAPDLVLLLGDYVLGGASHIEAGIAPFAALQAREGAFAVLGNHDHWDGPGITRTALRRAGIDLIDNRSSMLSRRGDRLAIAGVGDLMEDDQLLEQALQGIPPQIPRIVLSHNPDYAEQMPGRTRVDLMVSGHTHGGQVQVPFYGAPRLPSRYGRKYQEGLVQGPCCPVYVSRGVSTISPPVRFLCRPEVSLLQLVPA